MTRTLSILGVAWRVVSVSLCVAAMAGCVGPVVKDSSQAASAIDLVTYDEPAGPLFSGPAEEPSDLSLAIQDEASVRMAPIESLSDRDALPVSIDSMVRQSVVSSTAVRDSGQFLSPGNTLLNRPELTPSSFDSEIHAAGPTGEIAALAAFDAQIAAGVQWGRDSLLQANSVVTNASTPANLLVSASGAVYGRVDKATRHGGRLSLIQNWNYQPNSLATGAFNARHIGFLRAEVREPLLAGRGARFTEIAGPILQTGGRLGRGLRVARLDQEASLDEFETRLIRLVQQTQDAYLDLWLSHEDYRLAVESRDQAQALLSRIEARNQVGLAGAGAAEQALAEEAVLSREVAANNALASVYARETRLRRLVGLPAADGKTLIPIESPFEGDISLDASASVAAAVASRVELRRQRNRVEVLELQNIAAGSLMQPRIDLVAGVQVNGFGDQVISGNGAVDSLFGGENTGWSVGVEYTATVGKRVAFAQLKRFQLELSKARQVLAAQEEEVRHEVVDAHREIERRRRGLRISDRRVAGAEKRLSAAEAEAATGRGSVDLVVRGQAALVEARRARAQGLVDYNKAVVELKRREGRLLAEHQVELAESTPSGGGRSR